MTDISRLAVIAVYSNRGSAEAAVDELWHAGFEKEQIGFLARGGEWKQATTQTEGLEETGAHGAVVGSVAGGVVGALAGAVVSGLIPGIGLVIAGGILTGLIGGAAAGSALGAFAGPFVAMGLSKEEASSYETQFRAGRTIVLVQIKEDVERQEEAVMILRSHKPTHLRVVGQPVSTVNSAL